MTALPPGLAVEVNLTGPTSDGLILDDATRGLLDSGTLGGGELEWVDVTPYVRSGSINRGVSRFEGPYGRADAGRAQVVLDNRDARFDPTNLDGPYVAAGASQVTPMRAWRIRAGGFDLWRGFADRWHPTYLLSGKDAVVALTGTDGTKVLAGFNGAEQASQGAGETTGARIERILDHAGWPAEDRDIATGLTVVEATTLAQPAWTMVLLTSDTEIGEVYFDGQGKLVFRDRHALLTEERSITAQAVFTDQPGGLGYVDLVIETDDTQLANLVRIHGPGFDPEQVAEDTASQAKYLTRTFVRTDLLIRTAAEALEYAEYVLYLLHEAELRFDSLTIDPRSDPLVLYPEALGRELGDRITVSFTPPGRPGDPIERDVYIRGISHVFDAGGTWRTTWALQDASKFNALVLDHAELGKLDTGRLGPN